jgi:hypothetical protein
MTRGLGPKNTLIYHKSLNILELVDNKCSLFFVKLISYTQWTVGCSELDKKRISSAVQKLKLPAWPYVEKLWTTLPF